MNDDKCGVYGLKHSLPKIYRFLILFFVLCVLVRCSVLLGIFPSSPFSGRIVILPFWSYDPCHPRTVVPQCHEFCSYPERARAAQVIQFRRHVPLKTTVFPQCQVIFRYIFGWECAALFQTKIYDFSCSTSAWLSKCIPYFRPCKVLQFRELWIRFTVKPYGTL